MIYIITTNSGKPFLPKNRSFNISGYIGDVYVLENNRDAKIWADQQVIYNNGRIVDKATAQAAIDTAFNNASAQPAETTRPNSKPNL